jgi:hypothetical protein
MRFDLKQPVRVLTASLLAVVFAVPSSLVAQTHVVSPSDLRKEAAAATQARQQDLEKVQRFLSSDVAQKALQTAHVNAQRVQTAVSSLSDQELAQLAARADKAQADFAAGTLSDRDLILIILGVVALVLIIVAVR